MNSKTFWLLAVLLLTSSFQLAKAEQSKTVPRIGFLDLASPATSKERNAAFRSGLRGLGYVEGRNIEYRSADENVDRLPDLAAELVRLKVDAIVTQASPVARVVAKLTKSMPIINAGGGSLIGLVDNFSRPGGNITGVSGFYGQLNPKRLELIKEILPNVSRVAALPSPAARTYTVTGSRGLVELKQIAKTMKVDLQILEVQSAQDLSSAFAMASTSRAGAIMLLPDPTGIYIANMSHITELSIRDRIPVVGPTGAYANAGALMSYEPNEIDLWRRAAVYVDKILRGANPATFRSNSPRNLSWSSTLKQLSRSA